MDQSRSLEGDNGELEKERRDKNTDHQVKSLAERSINHNSSTD